MRYTKVKNQRLGVLKKLNILGMLAAAIWATVPCSGDLLLIERQGERWLVNPQQEVGKSKEVVLSACDKGLENPARGSCVLMTSQESGEFYRNLAAAFAIPSQFAGLDALNRVTVAMEKQREEIENGGLSPGEQKAILERLKLNEVVQRKLLRIQKYLVDPLNRSEVTTLDPLYQLDPGGLENDVAVRFSITSTLVRTSSKLFRTSGEGPAFSGALFCVPPFRRAKKKDVGGDIGDSLKEFFNARVIHRKDYEPMSYLVWITGDSEFNPDDFKGQILEKAYFLLDGKYYRRKALDNYNHLCVLDLIPAN